MNPEEFTPDLYLKAADYLENELQEIYCRPLLWPKRHAVAAGLRRMSAKPSDPMHTEVLCFIVSANIPPRVHSTWVQKIKNKEENDGTDA